MKVVHIIKRIETIDEDIKDLRKLEKSISKNKSFSTPIYLSIEKQINILLDTRIKLLGLTIANPPADLVKAIEGDIKEDKKEVLPEKKTKPKKGKSIKLREKVEDDQISILTQDLIDEKFNKLKEEKERQDEKIASDLIKGEGYLEEDDDDKDDNSIKLLDIALENGSINKGTQEKERKKVKFFKDNFPGGDF